MTTQPDTQASLTPSTELSTKYTPAEVEGPLYERWVEAGYFTPDASSDKPPFSVVIPPGFVRAR